ncbi:MAG: ABC1 kinase family protein [Alphaproteobacteria bacterium]
MDENNLTGRVKRYGGVSKAVGGLAWKLASNKVLGTKLDKDQHSEALKLALGNLKGPIMKAAQILATIPEALPKEYAEELRQLQSNAPAMSWPFVRRRMKSELGADWQSKFADFEREATAAASLGQVHRATSETGEALACKLQYADMASAVEADVTQLKLALKAYRAFDKAIDPSLALDEVTERLREELDYCLEAKHTELFRHIFAAEFAHFDTSLVNVPKIHTELSSSKLLTMSWLEGRPMMSLLKEGLDQDQRNSMAERMFYTWNLPLYHFGVVHGDPHLGNYAFTDDGKVNLLDFGCVRKFSAKFIEGTVELYRAKIDQDEDRAVAAFESWGFKNLSKDLIEVLDLWADFLYAPVLQDKKLRISETSGIEKGAGIVQDVHKALREQGGVTIPPEFVFMDRAAVGLGSVYIHLDAELNWYQMFNNLIEGFETDLMGKRQAEALAAVGL